MRAARRFATSSIVGAACAVALAELLHWRASRRELGADAGDGPEAVIVLGCPPHRDGRSRSLQRWRCRIAARSMDPRREGVVIFTGAGPYPDQLEAEVMSRYAREELGIPADRIRLERKAENTWQNIEFSTPFLEDAATIKIASDPMHAARARRFLHDQRPDLAARLSPADDYRVLESWWMKVPTAVHELLAATQLRAQR